MVVIRPYEDSDFVQCEKIAREFQEKSVFKEAGWDSEKFNYLSSNAAKPDSDIFAFVADLDGIIIGAFIGYVSEYFFSSSKISQDLIVIVLPKYRSHAYECIGKMLSSFESWSKDKNAVEVCVGSSTALNNNNYKNFLEKNGYEDVGFITKKRV